MPQQKEGLHQIGKQHCRVHTNLSAISGLEAEIAGPDNRNLRRIRLCDKTSTHPGCICVNPMDTTWENLVGTWRQKTYSTSLCNFNLHSTFMGGAWALYVTHVTYNSP